MFQASALQLIGYTNEKRCLMHCKTSGKALSQSGLDDKLGLFENIRAVRLSCGK
jgi:hypothetical protein